MTDSRAEFHAWATTARPRLRKTAYLLCGDWHLAEDLTQDTLVRVYSKWHRVESGSPDGYARTTLLNAFRSVLRRPWRRETARDIVPEQDLPTSPAASDWFDQRAVLMAALAGLGRAQREVVVLRFWEDMSVAEVADTLRISVGTVKSQTSRGLQRLRAVLDSAPAATNEGERR